MVLWTCDHFWCWPSLIEYSSCDNHGCDWSLVFHWRAQRGHAPPTLVMNDNPVWPCLVSLTSHLDTKLNGNGNTAHGWPFNLLLVFKIYTMIWVLKSCMFHMAHTWHMCQSVSFVIFVSLYLILISATALKDRPWECRYCYIVTTNSWVRPWNMCTQHRSHTHCYIVVLSQAMQWWRGKIKVLDCL